MQVKNEIQKKHLENKLKHNGKIMLTYKIDYPEIKSSPYEYGKEVFNTYYADKAFMLQRYCENILFEEAKRVNEENEKNGYPVMQYEVILTYEITLNQANIVSLYMDNYTFTGGAHGNTIRQSKNWNLQQACQIPISYFYEEDPYYILDILKHINTEIKERIHKNEASYFDNYCQLVIDTFQLENYYVTPTHLVVFFQQYDIAPYATGIPTFSIPFV